MQADLIQNESFNQRMVSVNSSSTVTALTISKSTNLVTNKINNNPKLMEFIELYKKDEFPQVIKL